MKTTKIPKSKIRRSINWGWRQKAKTKTCPPTPRMDHKIVVITGGNSGVGLETVKGLSERGAEVIFLSRNKSKSEAVVKTLKGNVHFVQLDLGNLDTFNNTLSEIEAILKGRKIDLLICNAGIGGMHPHTLSPQGYEIIFAVNVLGHHVLFKRLHLNKMLSSHAHIIAVTGDIYFQANDCTPNFEYEGDRSMQAYARSKVGVMWWGLQCHKLYPEYKVNLVHPGVIPMGLASDQTSILIRIMGKIMLSPKGGAQTTLNCATQPNIENGGYYHNTMGKAILPEGDIALDEKASSQFWQTLETIYTKETQQ